MPDVHKVFALWEREDPLAELYAAFEKAEDHHMEKVNDTLENHADFLITEKQRKIREMPVYVQTAAYAKEHGEADLHSESHKANVMCANAIEDTIALHYDIDKKRLDPAGAAKILELFGPERTSFVLAANIQDKSWDGRITDSNKEWAKQFAVPQDDSAWGTKRYRQYPVTSHPGLLDLFTKQVQKKLEQLQEQKPSVLGQLKTQSPRTSPKFSAKSKEQER